MKNHYNNKNEKPLAVEYLTILTHAEYVTQEVLERSRTKEDTKIQITDASDRTVVWALPSGLAS